MRRMVRQHSDFSVSLDEEAYTEQIEGIELDSKKEAASIAEISFISITRL